jgi:hypothetical protein
VANKVADVVELEPFLPESFADILENLICRSGELQWQYNASTNDPQNPHIMNKDPRSYEGGQFVHAIYQAGERRSPFFDIVFPMFYFMEERTGVALAKVERMKANLLMQKDLEPDRYNTPHIDIPDAGFKSLLYYVADSDGDTFLFNERYGDKKGLTVRKRVAPRKNKAVLFDSSIWHASSPPRTHATRYVLNFIFAYKLA